MSKCGMKCEVYSRVVGYYRPIADWNVGKREEYKDRKVYSISPPVEEEEEYTVTVSEPLETYNTL